MKKTGTGPKTPIRLRDKIEEFVTKSPSAIKKIPPRDLCNLLEDLQVCQIELEKHNDDLREAYEALQKREERYREFVEGADDLITRLDSNGRFVYVNDGAEKVFGISTDRCLGRSAFDFVHPDDRERTRAEFAGWIRNRLRSATIENRQVNQITGEVFYMLWSSNLRYDAEGNLTGINGIARDLTKYKKLEEALLKTRKLESIAILAGGIAHDFNNLLSVILVNIASAESALKPGSEGSEFLKEAEKASMRAKDLTARLVTFSKGGEPVRKSASVAELVKESITSALGDSDIDCEYAVSNDLFIVDVDEGQMKQAIHNIAVNAREAMFGRGTIAVHCENVISGEEDDLPLGDGEYVKISIKDQGVGIPEGNLSKIFDPYFSTKDMGTQKGMGLGLAVTHSIINRHGGQVTVESEVGVGTVFTFYLPAAEKVVRELKPTEEPRPEKPSIRTGRILVMDDEEMIRTLAKHALSQLDYDAGIAKDGNEAVELYKNALNSGKPFEAVILDLTVKGAMGGKDAVKKILEIDPHAKVIVSSGFSNDPVMTNYRGYGFIEALPKPYTMKNLRDVLNKLSES